MHRIRVCFPALRKLPLSLGSRGSTLSFCKQFCVLPCFLQPAFALGAAASWWSPDPPAVFWCSLHAYVKHVACMCTGQSVVACLCTYVYSIHCIVFIVLCILYMLYICVCRMASVYMSMLITASACTLVFSTSSSRMLLFQHR